jgi:YesN/AraC family two-component response regulator
MSKKILVLEDEALIAHDIKQILENEGYQAIVDCFNMDLAIDLAHQFNPDLVLIDINLNHKKTGMDFATYWHKEFAKPFIFLTSYSDKSTLNQLLSFDHSGFITKPFKPIDLISTVYLALNKSGIENRENEKNSSDTPFPITQVLRFIHLNVKERIDIKSLAAMTNWETEYFGKLFKAHLGISPYQYILKQKVELAKQMLAQSDYEFMEDLSFELGFSSYSNFYNAFKKFTNLTPQEYRKMVY